MWDNGSLEPPRRGAWVEHMTHSHKQHQLMRCVHICSMVDPPQGIVPHGFQWVLFLKRRLAMKEMLLVSYKQPRPSSPNRCEIMALSLSKLYNFFNESICTSIDIICLWASSNFMIYRPFIYSNLTYKK
jgi:hypothetical protein